MSTPSQVTRKAIAERRSASGLGVGCAEAQADGVPCPEPDRDCDNCAKAAEAVKGSAAKTRG